MTVLAGAGAGAAAGLAPSALALLLVSPALWAAFIYQLLIPGLSATLIWFALVGRIGAIKASAFHFLNPFFGVAIAAGLVDPLKLR